MCSTLVRLKCQHCVRELFASILSLSEEVLECEPIENTFISLRRLSVCLFVRLCIRVCLYTLQYSITAFHFNVSRFIVCVCAYSLLPMYLYVRLFSLNSYCHTVYACACVCVSVCFFTRSSSILSLAFFHTVLGFCRFQLT